MSASIIRINRLKHTSNGIIKSKLGQVASLVRGVKDLIVEDREVKSQTETDGVSGSKVGLGDFSGSLVGLEGGVGSALTAVTDGELGKITVVVTLPIVKRKTPLLESYLSR